MTNILVLIYFAILSENALYKCDFISNSIDLTWTNFAKAEISEVKERTTMPKKETLM